MITNFLWDSSLGASSVYKLVNVSGYTIDTGHARHTCSHDCLKQWSWSSRSWRTFAPLLSALVAKYMCSRSSRTYCILSNKGTGHVSKVRSDILGRKLRFCSNSSSRLKIRQLWRKLCILNICDRTGFLQTTGNALLGGGVLNRQNMVCTFCPALKA